MGLRGHGARECGGGGVEGQFAGDGGGADSWGWGEEERGVVEVFEEGGVIWGGCLTLGFSVLGHSFVSLGLGVVQGSGNPVDSGVG